MRLALFEHAPRYEFAVIGHQVDDVAVGRVPFQAVDRAIQNPRVAAIEGTSFAQA